MLSQEEIDALLKGDNNVPSQPDVVDQMTDMEIDAIGEIANISMGTAATTLSTLLGRKVDITTPRVSLIHKEQLNTDHPLPYVTVDVQYKEGLNGNSVLIIKQDDASVIVDLMMGGDGIAKSGDLDEMQISAIGEAMNQMMGSAATSLSTVLNGKIDISPPNISLVNFANESLDDKVYNIAENLARVSFRIVIDSLVDSEMMQLIPIQVAKNMVSKLMGEIGGAEEPVRSSQQENKEREEILNAGFFQMDESEKQKTQATESITAKPAQFAPLSFTESNSKPNNIDLLLDISLQLSVELGKTKKTIKEILELTSGSLIELDKLAGEPVDILVNGKLIAKGEVVVIDESFGVRVTDIVSPIERVNNLK